MAIKCEVCGKEVKGSLPLCKNKKCRDDPKLVKQLQDELNKLKETKLILIGSSADGRANRWKIDCSWCRHQYYPEPTLLAIRSEQCPKCSKTVIAYYNNEVARKS